MTLTEEQIAEIRARAEAATPGPWKLCHHLKSKDHDESCHCGYRGGIWSGDGEFVVCEMGSSPDVDGDGFVQGHSTPQCPRDQQLFDAAFIFRARTDIPALLSALEAANKRAAEAEGGRTVRQERIEKLEARLLDVLAANKRADEAEAAREAMREDRDSQQRVCIAVMTERDALRARVAELEGAAGRGTILIRTIPGETGDAIREWSCSECYPGWFDTEDSIVHRDNCVFAVPKGASHAE